MEKKFKNLIFASFFCRNQPQPPYRGTVCGGGHGKWPQNVGKSSTLQLSLYFKHALGSSIPTTFKYVLDKEILSNFWKSIFNFSFFHHSKSRNQPQSPYRSTVWGGGLTMVSDTQDVWKLSSRQLSLYFNHVLWSSKHTVFKYFFRQRNSFKYFKNVFKIINYASCLPVFNSPPLTLEKSPFRVYQCSIMPHISDLTSHGQGHPTVLL